MNLDELKASTSPVLTVTETASLLGIDVRTVRKGVDAGQIPGTRIGNRILIHRVPLMVMLGIEVDE